MIDYTDDFLKLAFEWYQIKRQGRMTEKLHAAIKKALASGMNASQILNAIDQAEEENGDTEILKIMREMWREWNKESQQIE